MNYQRQQPIRTYVRGGRKGSASYATPDLSYGNGGS